MQITSRHNAILTRRLAHATPANIKTRNLTYAMKYPWEMKQFYRLT
jgi:hypothetical protein